MGETQELTRLWTPQAEAIFIFMGVMVMIPLLFGVVIWTNRFLLYRNKKWVWQNYGR